MLKSLRIAAVGTVLAIATPSSMAGEKETLSELGQIALATTSESVIVTISGSKAPDFTSFTMSEPFRVVVDWAGSKLGGIAPEKSYDRGLIRRISTKQFDSEAEKISRVIIELSRETTYHVEADGKRVKVRFVPVPDPIPEPEVVEPVKEEIKQAPAKVAQAAPEGPLTEPDVAVPAELPPMPAKKQPPPVVIAEKPATQTQPPVVALQPAPEKKVEATTGRSEPAKTVSVPTLAVAKETKQTAPVVALEKPRETPAPATVTVETKKQPEAQPVVVAAKTVEKPAEKVVEKPAVAKQETPPIAEKPALVAVAEKPAEKTIEKPAEKAIEKPAEKPAEAPVLAAKTEKKPEKLASFPGVVPEKLVKQETRDKEMVAPSLKTTPASTPQKEAPVQTTRMASAMPQQGQRSSANVWQPPTIPLKEAVKEQPKKQLPVVKLASAQGEPLKPTSTLPADPEEPTENEKSSSNNTTTESTATLSSGNSSGDDFDPGPRVMKYIGFQQMAEVSRVFVRCDGKAKFREVKEGSTFVLELSNTSINVKNNERPLDTTYFNTAVTKVQAVKSGDTTRIEVKLREQVPYKITRIGNTIAIDFKRG